MRTNIATLSAILPFMGSSTWAFSAGSMKAKSTFTGSVHVCNHNNHNNHNNDKVGQTVLYGVENDDMHQDDDEPSGKSRKQKTAKKTSGSRCPDFNFATGEELINLRSDVESLRHNLQWAQALKNEKRIESLEKAIIDGEARDPDFMYSKALRLMGEAKKMKDVTEEEKDAFVSKWVRIAASARESLQQFNMEGLWVGNYGEHGMQVVNITYTDDTIIAKKVTGDKNVPRGETTFTADLSPKKKGLELPPISLQSETRRGEFQRFPGHGQVSRSGFKDNRFVEGQMILFEKGFSFVWVPTKHHVFFQRATPEQTIRLLRDTMSKEDELEMSREHIARCFDMDMTTCLARQQDPTNFEPIRRITPQEDLDQVARNHLKENQKNLFWQVGKWRKYIDQALGEEGGIA